MATITIPENAHGDNPMTVLINGVKYNIPRGSSVEVSSAVAAEIQRMLGHVMLNNPKFVQDIPTMNTFWATTEELSWSTPMTGPTIYVFTIADMHSKTGAEPAIGDIIYDDDKLFQITKIKKNRLSVESLLLFDLSDYRPAGSSSGGGVLVVHQNAETGALDKTWQEIHDAGFAVLQVDATEDEFEGVGFATILAIGMYGDNYAIKFTGNDLNFVASSASDYPAHPELEPAG